MERWTRWVLAHRLWVVAFWVVVATAGGILAPTTVDRLGYDFGLPGQPAYEANQDIRETYGNGGDTDPLILSVALPEARTFDDADVRRQLGAIIDRIERPGWRTASVLDDPRGAESPLVSDDRRTAAVLVYPPITPGPSAYAQALPQVEAALEGRDVAGAPVRVTGIEPLNESGGGSDRPIIYEILLGGAGALIVLVLTFGSLLTVVPLLLATVAITTTFLLVLGLTALTEVSFIVQYLVGLIGLGVAIDYALLIVMRWRQENSAESRDADPDEPIVATMNTAGRTVIVSGVTVAISLLALVVLPLPFLRSVGYGGLLIPLVSVLVALTLLPIILATVGRRLEWPHRRSGDSDSRAWRAVGRFAVRHRIVTAVLASAVLLAMAAPSLGMRLGSPELGSISGGSSAPAQGYRALAEAGISPGLTRPIEVLVEGGSTEPVREAVAGVDGVEAVIAPDRSGWRQSGSRLVEVVPADDPSTDTGLETVEEVRAALDGVDGVQVGGTAAQDIDAIDAIYGNAWWVLLLVVAVTFALLARALRSVWLPLKALLLNAVSIAAAYGITVVIWQHGFGTELLFGTSASGVLTFWVPVAAFSFLFGLSMDYEVFILSRIREGRDAGLPTDQAVVDGIGRTGRLVTSAALILFLAFVALSTVPVVDVKIFSTTLALGIILDATIVRGVLTPALVAWFGRINWWWPRRAVPAGAAGWRHEVRDDGADRG